jgi:hypothetical protein
MAIGILIYLAKLFYKFVLIENGMNKQPFTIIIIINNTLRLWPSFSPICPLVLAKYSQGFGYIVSFFKPWMRITLHTSCNELDVSTPLFFFFSLENCHREVGCEDLVFLKSSINLSF